MKDGAFLNMPHIIENKNFALSYFLIFKK